MKPKAVLFNLWEKHFSVLRAFSERCPNHLLIVPHSGFLTYGPFKSFAGRIVPLDQILSQSEKDALAMAALDKARFLREFMQSAAWDAFCLLNGVPSGPTAKVLVHDAESRLLQQILQVEALEKLRENLDIRATVVNEESTLLLKSMVVWSKTAAIPVLHICHSLGMIGWYSICDALISDAFAVYGHIVADGPMEKGFPGNRIFITGNPDWADYERTRSYKDAVKLDVKARLFPGSDAPMVVFGTNWNAYLTAMVENQDASSPGLMQAFFRSLSLLRKKGRPVNGIVKLRSNNDESMEMSCAELAAKEGLNPGEVVFVRTDLDKLLLGADAIVSIDSTLSSDALLADTTAINLITEFGWRLGPYYPNYTGILECRPEDLALSLEAALFDVEVQKDLKEMRTRSRSAFQGGEHGSNPTARLTDIIEQMISSPQAPHPTHAEVSNPEDFAWDEWKSGTLTSMELGNGLECSLEPVRFMEKVGGLLADGGEITCRIGNVSHWPILRALVEGNWNAPKEPERIRFFTLAELESFLNESGFSIVEKKAEAGQGFPDPEFMGFLEAVGKERDPFPPYLSASGYSVKAKKRITAPAAYIRSASGRGFKPSPTHGERKMTLVIRPVRVNESMNRWLADLIAGMTLPYDIVCLISPAQTDIRPGLPAGVDVLEVAGGCSHSRRVLQYLLRNDPAGLLAFVDPGTKLAPGWDKLIANHVANGSVVAPLVNLAGGTQCIYHYLPPGKVDPENVESVSRQVRLRFPGLALSTDWLYNRIMVFGCDLLERISGLQDEPSDTHFLGLGQKLKLAGAKFIVAKDVYARLDP